MAGRVVWHRLAEEDLTEAYLYIGGDSPAAADRLLDAVERALQLLSEHLAAGGVWVLRSQNARGLRSWAVGGFEDWLLFYRVFGDDLEVVRFLHGSRDLPRLLEHDPPWIEGP